MKNNVYFEKSTIKQIALGNNVKFITISENFITLWREDQFIGWNYLNFYKTDNGYYKQLSLHWNEYPYPGLKVLERMSIDSLE